MLLIQDLFMLLDLLSRQIMITAGKYKGGDPIMVVFLRGEPSIYTIDIRKAYWAVLIYAAVGVEPGFVCWRSPTAGVKIPSIRLLVIACSLGLAQHQQRSISPKS